MSLNIDIKRILPVKVSEVSPKLVSTSVILRRPATLRLLGKCSTRSQSALHWYNQNLCSFDQLWSMQPFPSQFRWILDVDGSFQDTTQNLRRRRLLRVEDWWRFIINQWQLFPWIFSPLNSVQTVDLSHLVHSQILMKCRTCAAKWDIWNSWWNFEYPRNSFPWMSSNSSSQSWTFPKLMSAFLQNLKRSTFFSDFFRTWSITLFTNFAASLPMTKVSDCLFLQINTISLPRSITNYLSEFYGLRISVEKNISMMRTNLLHRIPGGFIRIPWSINRRSLTFPLLRRQRMSIIFFWSTCWGESVRFPWSIICHNRFPRILIFISCLPGFDEVQDDTTEDILAVKFITGLDFAVTRSSSDSCWTRFVIAAEQIVELKWLMLNKFIKWFHSSRVKLPLTRMSANWLMVSIYLTWTMESRLIRSNSKSRVTLRVLETCLIGGLLPLMTILITASLSSNTYNKACWRADWTFEGTSSMFFVRSILLWDLWCLWLSLSDCADRCETRKIFPRTETFRSHNSRAGNPSNLIPASKEMISDSVELWETAVCFLHIRLIGTKVWLPQTSNVPPEVDFESSRSPAKSESWNSVSLHWVTVLPTWQHFLYSQVWWIYEINRFRHLSQTLIHFMMDRASLFAVHRISGRPIRVKYKHFRTIWEHTCDNSPTDFISSSLKWRSSMHGVDSL